MFRIPSMSLRMIHRSLAIVLGCFLLFVTQTSADAGAAAESGLHELRESLDAPLLFVKRHAYFAGHIYDDYITWHPGGGIYILENPADPPALHRIRTVIDATTNETLGEGVYRDPELSWDARRIVFAFKATADGHTCLYEIGLDGRGLRRLTNPDVDGACAPQENRIGKGHHDVTPAYLPDGRIVFTSTRPRALVPCFNSGVDTLHVMNGDGTGIHGISVNNVNEFDPAVLHDGRILFGRWEYVDKTALYMQSLWTIAPDGRMEEALFGNNLARPTAILDARPVPDSPLIAASLTPHNGQAVGAIVTIDPRAGKNNLAGIVNFTPEYPVEMDQGLKVGPSDPWPLSEELILIANNAEGHAKIQLIHRDGRRLDVIQDPDISCYSPMLVKPRTAPVPVAPAVADERSGRFVVTDIYRGLQGVPRGTIKRLRVVEETARTSGLPPGGRWWNQAFLVSWQGSYIVKNILGVVPVHEDGSAHFEVPSGRAVYFEALDEQGREVQRMRTFVQAAPGVTRSCIGCHEHKSIAPERPAGVPLALLEDPVVPEPESWGSGFIDFSSMVQPVLDRHCVSCHGGEQGMAKGIDLSGGWTWAFNIAYETLIKQQLTGFLNCHNSSVHTSKRLPPYTIGSGGAPLVELLLSGHGGRTEGMPQRDIDLLMAWMDTNSNYYGTWDYTPYATAGSLLSIKSPLTAFMQREGCTQCHDSGHIGNDWINLQRPEWSRVLRAPMARSASGLGLAMCRNRHARVGYPLVDQRVQPPDLAVASRQPPWEDAGDPHVVFTGPEDPRYEELLSLIWRTRLEVLATPRVDMPGAEVVGGECRMQVPPPLPLESPPLSASLTEDGTPILHWPRTAETIGLQYEIYRNSMMDFELDKASYLGLTTAGQFSDVNSPAGKQYYALAVSLHGRRGTPSRISLSIPEPLPPATPGDLSASSLPGAIALNWSADQPKLRFQVDRRNTNTGSSRRLTTEPIAVLRYQDVDVRPGVKYEYQVTAVDRRGLASSPTRAICAIPLPLIREPVFVASFVAAAEGQMLDGVSLLGKIHKPGVIENGQADFSKGGFIQFPHRSEFDLCHAISVECWVRIEEPTRMPVVLSCGVYNQAGWFLQRYGQGWRWHLGGVSCDGGRPVVGDWTHLVATFDGQRLQLFQDGKPVATVEGEPNRTPSESPLYIGQYRGTLDESYQVRGRIAGVKVYQRALGLDEIQASFSAGHQPHR